MALKKTFIERDNFNIEVELVDCYCKVDRIIGGKNGLDIILNVYNSDQTGLLLERRVKFSPLLDSENFIKQAYSYIKTLPEFADATDC